jgi:hypothetical protein
MIHLFGFTVVDTLEMSKGCNTRALKLFIKIESSIGKSLLLLSFLIGLAFVESALPRDRNLPVSEAKNSGGTYK